VFKKLLFSLFLAFTASFLFLSSPAVAKDDLSIYLFWSKSCPHCAEEKAFLQALEKKYPALRVNLHETSNPQSNKLLQDAGKILSADISHIPLTIIGNNYLIGYLDDETTGQQIESIVKDCLKQNNCPDIFSEPSTEKKLSIPENIKLPLIGSLKTKSLSLPLLAFLIALLDGFNPCAMWTLLFLISLLLNMKDKKRMWILGFSFIAASAFVYFLFMSAWLNLFLFIGLINWVRIIIGSVALFAAYYQLKDYFLNKKGTCKTEGDQKRKKTFEKIKLITQKDNLFIALFGIILLAFAVNLVELLCSAGLPAIFTQILVMNDLPVWQYYSYLVFYVLIFMLDDMIIFYIAMRTLHAVGIESKYARLSRLLGGIVILIIGLLMLFKPELLAFG